MKVLDFDGLKKLVAKIKELLDKKVDKIEGKTLSDNNYTNSEKNKVKKLPDLSNEEFYLNRSVFAGDFNSVTMPGIHIVRSTTNSPHSDYSEWSVIVLYSNSYNNTNYIQQIALCGKKEDESIYIRKCTQGGWSRWISIRNQDLSNLATIAQVNTLELRVSKAVDDLRILESGVYNDITGNPFTISFENNIGIKLDRGVFNKDKRVIEC